MTDLEKLAADIAAMEPLAKAVAADPDDKTIQAAAGGENLEEEEELEGKEKGKPEGEGAPLGKSFSFTLEDGTQVDAIDGSELVKSLIERVDGTEATLAKALGQTVALVKSQQDAIVDLRAQVALLAGSGRGRKAVLSVAEKPEQAAPLAKSEPSAMSREEFFMKADAAVAAGRLSHSDVMHCETLLNRGMPVPAQILNRVVG